MASETARLPNDDDELPGLPALDGDDTALDVDPAALAEDIDDSDGEEVGLDDEEGTGEDEDELDDDGAETLATDWETGGDPEEEDPELADGDEGGWTEGSDAAEAPGWDSDLDDGDHEESPSIRDAGEEGVEERYDGEGEEDVAVLPPLARGEEELADDLQLDEEGEIDAPADDRPEHPALSLLRTHAAATWLGPADDPIFALEMLGPERGLACGRALHVIDGDRAVAVDAEGLEGDEPTSAARTASGAWIVGLRMGGAARSRDGRTFERIATRKSDSTDELRSTGPFYVLGEALREGARLWGRTRAGALARSDDEGATWTRPLLPGAVIALARAADGGVLGILGGRHGPLRVVRTPDGGRSWRSIGGPAIDAGGLPEESELHVAAIGPHIVIACDAPGVGPFASSDDGQTWRIVDPIRDAGPLAAIRERGVDVIYAGVFLEGRDRGLVVRMPLDREGEARVVIDLDEIRSKHHLASSGDSEGDQRIHAIAALSIEGGTEITIATGIGVVRAIVRAETSKA